MSDKPDETRRNFLRGTAFLAMAAAATGEVRAGEVAAPSANPVALPQLPGSRIWLGPDFWANRLQDWQLSAGRIECRRADAGQSVRTANMLTREIVAGKKAGSIEAIVGLITGADRTGYGGFLIGIGEGRLDWRSAAMAHNASGLGGGIMAVLDTKGGLNFRDHSDEKDPFAFAILPSTREKGGASLPGFTASEAHVLRLDLTPTEKGYDLALSLRKPGSEKVLSRCVLRDVADEAVLGGISLVSSTDHVDKDGARWWFKNIVTSGEKIAVHPERAMGVILGSLHSLNEGVLKLTAQLMPIGASEPQTLRLDYRAEGASEWVKGPNATLEGGFVGRFRVTDWDASRNWDYRIVYEGMGGEVSTYEGKIRRDPGRERPLKIAIMNCVMAASRPFDREVPGRQMPRARFIGRWRPENFYFPHTDISQNVKTHDPDLLTFLGDQFYEHSPNLRDTGPDITLDMLYRWYLWVWAFRDLTRERPSILLVDDHDVYQGNVWGNGGREAPLADQNRGGYVFPAEFVKTVERTQMSHNPDPFDPAPIQQGIGVTFGRFVYGGVSFAVIEDRKFKTAPIQGEDLDVHVGELLGPRQEAFLAKWAEMDKGMPKVVLTQTLWGSLQTSPDGRPLIDFDADSYPPLARRRAIELVGNAGALMLSGDQHLASAVRHGTDAFGVGPVQFTAPAMASFWQRWFEPAEKLPNAKNATTGDFIDAFGARMRVMAVANPKFTFKEYREYVQGRYQGVDDRMLRSEGYGIVRVDHEEDAFVLECWPWDENPTAPGAQQFAGWPIKLAFDDTREDPS